MTEKSIAQPTSFGNPKPARSPRFFRIVGRWLGGLNRFLVVIAVTSCVVFVTLLAYAGVGIEHTEEYVSDGTVFSCRIDAVTTKGTKGKR